MLHGPMFWLWWYSMMSLHVWLVMLMFVSFFLGDPSVAGPAMDHGPPAVVSDVDSENQSVAWLQDTVELGEKFDTWDRLRPRFRDVFRSWGNPHLVVSENRGTPKSSILVRFSRSNHPFLGIPIYGHHHLKSAGSIPWRGFSIASSRVQWKP